MEGQIITAKVTLKKWGIIKGAQYQYLGTSLPITWGNTNRHYHFIKNVIRESDGAKMEIISHAPKNYFTKVKNEIMI